MNTNDPRAELEALQAQLATRQSTTCFAQAAIALVVALILSGAAGKLFWDSLRTPYLGVAFAAASVVLAVYAVLRYGRGRALLRGELERFERMLDLRRALGLDDASQLLPGR